MKPLRRSNVWMDNGAVYINTAKRFLRMKEWFGPYVLPYFMDKVNGIDVDTEEDYLMATFYHGRLKGEL